MVIIKYEKREYCKYDVQNKNQEVEPIESIRGENART